MNLSIFVDAAATLASAILAACAPIIVLKLSTMLKLNLDQSHRAAITSALDTAVGMGLQMAEAAGDARLGDVTVKSAALAAMVGYVKQAAPDAVSHFSLTDAVIAQKAAARLGAALHVTASTPVVALPLAPAPSAATPGSPIPAVS
ncbi:MAG: hypothetical protein HIU92_10905 [Proteobacteria bacterium]|nr:hypothetical protein [Pseudomonadota bacterium]